MGCRETLQVIHLFLVSVSLANGISLKTISGCFDNDRTQKIWVLFNNKLVINLKDKVHEGILYDRVWANLY